MADTLYHYCSTASFEAILRSKQARLSSLKLSNDSMEGRWVRKVLAGVCDEKGLKQAEAAHVFRYVDILIDSIDAMGFCLSTHDDMLSQWRGYADDGRGFCLGIRTDYLTSLTTLRDAEGVEWLRLRNVNYDLSSQQEIVGTVIDQARVAISNSASPPTPSLLMMSTNTSNEDFERRHQDWKKALSSLAFTLLPLVESLYTLKNPAFKEESEWRLFSYVDEDNEKLDFRAALDRIVPFIAVDLNQSATPITQVLIGPKNITPEAVISTMMKRLGWGEPLVRRSDATYR